MLTNPNLDLFIRNGHNRGQFKIYDVVGTPEALDHYVASFGTSQVPVSQATGKVAFIVSLTKVPEANLIETGRLKPYVREDRSVGYLVDIDEYKATIAMTQTMPAQIGVLLVKEAIDKLRNVEIPEHMQDTVLSVLPPLIAGGQDINDILSKEPDSLNSL